MKLSTLLMLLGILLWATTWRKWSDIWDRRRLSQIHQDIKTGRQRMTLYKTTLGLVGDEHSGQAKADVDRRGCHDSRACQPRLRVPDHNGVGRPCDRLGMGRYG
jgi:hypothetical protein